MGPTRKGGKTCVNTEARSGIISPTKPISHGVSTKGSRSFSDHHHYQRRITIIRHANNHLGCSQKESASVWGSSGQSVLDENSWSESDVGRSSLLWSVYNSVILRAQRSGQLLNGATV